MRPTVQQTDTKPSSCISRKLTRNAKPCFSNLVVTGTTTVQQTCWFENRPLGVNTLGNMMKQVSKDAKLSQLYTNHCEGAIAITLWGEAGLPDRQICHISGHNDPNSIRHYYSQPSRWQLRNYSNILSTAHSGEDETELPQQRQIQPLNQLTSAIASVQSSNQACSSSVTHGEILGGCLLLAAFIPFRSTSTARHLTAQISETDPTVHSLASNLSVLSLLNCGFLNSLNFSTLLLQPNF